jgi:hypothetical protein
VVLTPPSWQADRAIRQARRRVVAIGLCDHPEPVKRRLLLAAVIVAGVGAAAFFAGRGSVDRTRAPVVGGSYAAGREAAFSGFDGGWAFGVPYIVTLRPGGPGVTYRFARRWHMVRGVEYRACGAGVCSRRAP